jgi:diaminohydroxyphosphoribosylaminopyrimidine deaminase/5-amino-6-(5-phosphoribosylamino)uracil reductase
LVKTDHKSFMREALVLAARGEGFVEPNPMVGCVIVRGGRVVGRGYHKRFGLAHAEVNALREAGTRARESTAYVALEPCGHFGKTPPCVDALIAAGVRRVVAAMKDPNPLVAGRGFKKLRAAGIDVEVGVLAAEAKVLNSPFIKLITQKRPHVILKWAQSLDGRLATRTGDSKWISSLDSRKRVHELRARVDGVLVGINTVVADDPGLTARLAAPKRIATRIILDQHLRTPHGCKLVKTARKTPTIIFTSRKSRRASSHVKRYLTAGCEIVDVGADRQGLLLGEVLDELGRRQMANILVEGGSRVLGSFIQQRLADEAFVFVCPLLIGGGPVVEPLFDGPSKIKGALRPTVRSLERIGPDFCYDLRF